MSHNGTIEYIQGNGPTTTTTTTTTNAIPITTNAIKITITVLDCSVKSTSFPSPSQHPQFNIHKERVPLTKFNAISQKVNKYMSVKQKKEGEEEGEEEGEDIKDERKKVPPTRSRSFSAMMDLLRNSSSSDSKDKGEQETLLPMTKKGSGSGIFKNNNRLSLDIHIQPKKNSFQLIDTVSPPKPISLLDMENLQLIIVDDSPMNSKFLRHMLITQTHFKKEQIEVMENGTDLLSAVLTQNKKYNIIFMDNNMPLLKGYVIIKLLRSLSINSLIVGVTGDNIDVENNEMLLAGANLVFSKPIKKTNVDFVRHYYMMYGGDSITDGSHFLDNVILYKDREEKPEKEIDEGGGDNYVTETSI
jgi:CheY-like chemotaxis protein